MKTLKEIIVGSTAFFNSFNDFKSKDKDTLVITDNYLKGKDSLLFKCGSNDFFIYKLKKKNEFIELALNSDFKLITGMFIIPEFAEYIEMTIEDLKLLEQCFENMDEKHQYEKIIYDSYIENNGFFLTDEQLEKAYESYKSTRKKG